MACITSLLQSVPDIIWSGVIASCLTLLGVMLSNLSNTNRLLKQLEHDSVEKSKERTAALRREVYLSVAEELVKVGTHLASLPQLDLTKTNFADGMQGFFAATARLQLIGEPHTVLLVSKLSADYSALLLKLGEYLIPIVKYKSDHQLSDDFYNRSQAEINRLLSEMARNNESGKRDEMTFQVLKDSFEFHQRQANEYSDEKQAIWKNYLYHCNIFRQQLFGRLKEISNQHIPVMVELRRDLGLAGDLTELEAHFQQQFKRMQDQLDDLNSKVDLAFDNENDESSPV